MKTYAISTALLDGVSLDDAIARIARAGFREIELSGNEEHLDGWTAHATQARRALESAGIFARAVHTPPAGWNNGTLDEESRRASLDAAARCFSPASEIGAEIVICHPNSGSHDSFSSGENKANWARSRDSLAILAERARDANVRMAVENMPARGQCRPGVVVADLLEMIDGLGDDVGICLDIGHSNLSGLSVTDEVITAGERLLALHIQDNDGKGEDQHLLPTRGTIDWGAFLEVLDRIDYRGLRTLEVLKGAETDALLQDLATLRREWESR